jgi:hypothetical protein
MITEISEEEYITARKVAKIDPESDSFQYDGKHYTVMFGIHKGDISMWHYRCDSHDEIFRLSHAKDIDEYITLNNRKEILDDL